MSWLDEGRVPEGFNDVYLRLLPKGTSDRDTAHSVVRDPSDTRPLSGSNTDSKLLASAFRHAANGAVGDWAVQAQRGFISGKSMLENIVEVESHAMRASFNPRNRAALVLYDFAAFPSLARAYMWMALASMGFPAYVIRALQALYADNKHYFGFGGLMTFAFIGLAGVRQGCPASSTLFVTVIDPIIRLCF